MMQWDQAALDIIEQIPLPPVMMKFAKLDALRRARHNGLDRVTAEVARAVEKGYERVFGREATEMIRRMARGEPINLPEEFFEEDEEELFAIELCPAKYGACTAEKRRMMKNIVAPVRAKLKELGATDIILGKARTPLMSHHVLHIAIIGCPNCCLSPYFSDVGIVCTFTPSVKSSECIQCNACVRSCTEGALSLKDNLPVIDYERCIRCGGCVKECPNGALSVERSAYKVVAGGCGSRHPRIAETVIESTDAAGVLMILERLLLKYLDCPDNGHELSFYGMIQRYGI